MCHELNAKFEDVVTVRLELCKEKILGMNFIVVMQAIKAVLTELRPVTTSRLKINHHPSFSIDYLSAFKYFYEF